MANKNSGEGNSCSNMPQPMFYKIILSPQECTNLSIPVDFASRYCENIQNPVYLEVPDGEIWEVEVVHYESQIWLAKGWQDFSDYYSISCGHFLMFGYNGCSRFNVTIFDMSASEIEYPYNAAHGTHHAQERNQIELDDSIKISEDVLRNHRGKEKISDMVEDSIENTGKCPLGQSRKRHREEEDSEDDDSVYMLTERMEVEKSEEDVASPSFTSEGQKSGEGSRAHKQQFKIVMMTKGHKESSIAYQRAKTFKSENPFILSFMQPSYISKPYSLFVPVKFARKYILENCHDLVLRVPGKRCWCVKCAFETTKARIHSGWKAFVLDNKLKFGDVCIFEVIKGTKLIDVTIFPAAESTSMHKISGRKVPGVSDNSAPCSQSKIVHTKKLKQWRGDSYGLNSKNKEECGEGTEVERPVEILVHCPPGQGSKRKRQQEEAQDDISTKINTKSITVEEPQENEASPSSTRKTKKSRGSCRAHKQQSKIVSAKSEMVMEKESAIAYQRAKAFTSDNPFFICSMRPSYVSGASLTIPKAIASKLFPARHNYLVVQVPNKRSLALKCTVGPKNAKVVSGWKKFVLDNNIKVGDVCVFEQVTRSELSFNVIIFPAAEGV